MNDLQTIVDSSILETQGNTHTGINTDEENSIFEINYYKNQILNLLPQKNQITKPVRWVFKKGDEETMEKTDIDHEGILDEIMNGIKLQVGEIIPY